MSFQINYAAHMNTLPSNPIFSLMPKLSQPGFISFAAGVPSPESFPYQDLNQMCAKILQENGKEVFQYGSTEGLPVLRESIRGLFTRAGINASYDEIFVATGGQQLIDLFCKLLIEPGDAVLVETPTYSATLQILKTYRAVPICVNADADGMLPDDLEEKIKAHKPKFIYVIPNFQNPSGSTLTTERRKAIAKISAKHGVLVVEDDPYRELRFFGEHLPTIKSFEENGNIIYMTSTSKILCPGLRVGAAQVNSSMFSHLVVAKQAADMHSPNLSQAIVDAYLRSGLLEEHLKFICSIYREKLVAMTQAIKDYFPDYVKFTAPQGGLFIWCELPKNVNTLDLLPLAVDKRVGFIPGDQFFAKEGINNCMRLNFSNASVENIDKGIKIIGDLLKSSKGV